MFSLRSKLDWLTLLNSTLLLLVAGLAWIGVVVQATSMRAMGGADMGSTMATAPSPTVSVTELVAFVVAWLVMMTAMMLPSALPMILIYRNMARGHAARDNVFVPTWVFVLGYLVVWAGFRVLVYLASQLVALALAGNMTLGDAAPYGIAAVLLIAGVYQFTPLKRACLRTCQSPLAFLLGHWKSGTVGALRLGAEHGIYCCGCCWGLMAVLVVAGAMGLAWVVLIALVVFAEKLLVRGQWAAWTTGSVLLALGVLVALRPGLAILVRA
jgi:predicted metal-binding membrane protein